MQHSGKDAETRDSIAGQILARLNAAPGLEDPATETERILRAATRDGVLDAGRALELAARRGAGTLLPHLLGHTTFMGLELECGPDVFTTREETELLGWTAVRRLGEGGPRPLRLIDVGSGVGNLTCALATHLPESRVWALDIDPACVAMTRKNIARHGLADRVEAREGDLFAPLAGLGLEGTMDAVVSNPPYIASVRLQKDRAYLLDNEPKAAFDGGPFGISVQLRLVKDALLFLKPGGWLFFEFGLGQDKQVKQLVGRAEGYDLAEFVCDREGQPRVSLSRKREDA